MPEMIRFDPNLPLERARTIPSAWYFAPDIAADERDRVFANDWQCVGLAEDVAKPGDYLTADIAGEPVLVVRGADCELRAFFNVCRHRAAVVMPESCGSATKLRCRYHGWTYDLEGKLKGVPEFAGVCDFDKEKEGLMPLGAVEIWGPFVFIHVKPPREPFAVGAAPLADWATRCSPFAGMVHHVRREYRVMCNWKVYVDNYLDGGYHVNTVHPNLAGVLSYADYTTALFAQSSLQSAPLKPAEGDAGRTRVGERASYWWLWPNFMLNHTDGVMDSNLVLPVTEGECRVVFHFFFRETADHEFRSASLRTADEVQEEDRIICEDVQRGLRSRSYDTGRYSVEREAGAHHFHKLLARTIQSGTSSR